MAKFQCICGEQLWNGRVPNDIELTIIEINEWNKAINEDISIFDLPEYDAWKCPECERLYLFEGIKVTEVYELEELEYGSIIKCKCGNTSRFQEFIVYTDIEIDQLPDEVNYIREMTLPERKVHRCKECLRIRSYDKRSNHSRIFKYVSKPFAEGPNM